MVSHRSKSAIQAVSSLQRMILFKTWINCKLFLIFTSPSQQDKTHKFSSHVPLMKVQILKSRTTLSQTPFLSTPQTTPQNPSFLQNANKTKIGNIRIRTSKIFFMQIEVKKKHPRCREFFTIVNKTKMSLFFFRLL